MGSIASIEPPQGKGKTDTMPYLIYKTAAGEEIHEILSGMTTIGRITSSITVSDPSLSRQHAKITFDGIQAVLVDRGSRNGTFVNGQKIDCCPLHDGDSIRCGRVEFQFVETHPYEVEETPVPIVEQVSPEDTRFQMEDSIDRDKAGGSALRIREQDENQRHLNKLKILLEVSQVLSSPQEDERLLDKILDLVFEIMNVDRAAILLVDPETRALEEKAIRGRSTYSKHERFYSTSIVNFVRRYGKAILTEDASADGRVSGDSILFQTIRASMCVPLKPHDNIIGILYVDNLSQSGIYTKEDLEFITCLATQAGIAIENLRLIQKMRQEAVLRNKLEQFFPPSVTNKLRESDGLDIVDTEVTALFADISDFTEISSHMAPRQVIEMLNEYFQVMVEEIVFPYGGTLEKYIGDALFAVWGAPYQKEDDPQRAIGAAIEMQRAVHRLNQNWKRHRNLEISIHIGLNTGNVAAGNIGSKKLIQYATIGDTTNVTSRICNIAKAHEIVVSQSTYDRLHDRDLPFQKMRPVMVKGKEHPLQLYRLGWQEVKPDALPFSQHIEHLNV